MIAAVAIVGKMVWASGLISLSPDSTLILFLVALIIVSLLTCLNIFVYISVCISSGLDHIFRSVMFLRLFMMPYPEV